MEFLYKWIYTVVVIIVFTTFVDILMPNSDMKKYTKLILGFLVMATILSPLISLFNKEFSLSGKSFKFENQMESSYLKKQSEDYDSKQMKSVSKIYKSNLEKEMEKQIRIATGNNYITISVEVVEDVKAQNFGEIKKVIVNVSKGIKAVDKIEIGNKVATETKKTQSLNQPLKSKISMMYNISIDKIEIQTES